MTKVKVSSQEGDYTSISNYFIKYYMTDANGDFVKLYLYLAMLSASAEELYISDIADRLNCTEKDVCRGIKYWIKSGAISLRYNDNGDVTGISLLTLKRPDFDIMEELKVVDFSLALRSKNTDNTTDKEEAETQTLSEQKNIIKAPKKKQPDPKELSSFLHDKEISNLISEATAYCNRELSQKELNSLIYIKQQLGLSFDLCEYLLEYCAEMKKTKFSYIEKVAINWFEEGITTREEASEYLSVCIYQDHENTWYHKQIHTRSYRKKLYR